MNLWKPIAICSTTALVLSIAHQFPSASVAHAAGPCFDQPNMAAGLAGLNSAKGYLERAEHNKGGWRDAAIAKTNEALAETNKGCSIANK